MNACKREFLGKKKDKSPPAVEIRSFINKELHPIDSNPECRGCAAYTKLLI